MKLVPKPQPDYGYVVFDSAGSGKEFDSNFRSVLFVTREEADAALARLRADNVPGADGFEVVSSARDFEAQQRADSRVLEAIEAERAGDDDAMPF